ncbi:MAG: hypothetical protein NEA02_03060 [Thermoanaerobaculia bacterium]|nr:hypothetical protein [Thermoanaerobaculia bacterium]
MAVATPTPTPIPTGVGCHRWRYALRWERPSRLAILKNVLGNSVTTYSDYKAPGTGLQTDWPDPIANSVIPGAWNYVSPSGAGPTVGTYAHDCDSATAPACLGPKAWPNPDNEGEHPGIYYSMGTWDYPDPNSQSIPLSVYDPLMPPMYHPGSDTTGSMIWKDTTMSPLIPAPYGDRDSLGVIIPGQYDGWAWTLNYGYGAAPTNDVVYGPDPGPPLALMDETPLGDSIPGQTGMPLALSTAILTLGGGTIGPQATPGVGGLNQPTWTTTIPFDVVGTTATKVNWGLMTYQSAGITANYNEIVPVVSNDLGDVSAIEDSMRLKIYTSGSYPGLSVLGGTPSKGAIAAADLSLTTTWNSDPKKRCNRAYGVILCTDGQSNVGNTGTPGNRFWDSTTTPCAPDTGGTAFINFPPGTAEAMYLNGHQDGAGNAVIRPRTFAIGLSTDISRCELNRTAYRGRTDANAPNRDGGFVLYDGVNGDARLPHLDPGPPVDESGPSPPALPGPGVNRFGPDQTPPDNRDYAFFARDALSLYNSFLKIVRSSASGDYTTSSPVAGGSSSLGNIVILPSTKYPSWEGHLRALDTTNPLAIVELWDAGAVLTTPPQTYHPTPATRQLYTWDPSNSNALVPIAAGSEGTIDAICGGCGAAPAALMGLTVNAYWLKVIDFIRGNDGTETNVKRGWLLGPAINSTPAIVGPPPIYSQTSNVTNHKPFQGTYSSRRALVWVGSDDGLVHAFDFADGSEVVGLLPPNLIANQRLLYANYLTGETETGQQAEIDLHRWGVANSFRFSDVWFPNPPFDDTYRTVGILTTGPGGDLVAAIDVTHAFPGQPLATPAVAPDPNYGVFVGVNAGKPIDVLWTKNSSDYAGLFGSWSVPAMAASSFTTSLMTFGAGINPTSLYNGQQNANVFTVDPTNGALVSAPVVSAPLATPDPLVGLQTFADSVLFQTSARSVQEDNVANLSIQADTNGRVNALWGAWASPSTALLIDLNAAAGDLPQPVYYSPAAIGVGTQGCQIYVLGSGSLYERSPAVSGWNVNRNAPTDLPPTGSGFPDTLPPFVPNLYIALNKYKITDAAFGTIPIGTGALAAYIVKKQIGGETTGIPLDLTDPTYSDGTGVNPIHTRLGIHTQVTSSPFLLVDSKTGVNQALFLVYDPDYGCNGYSYIVIVKFTLPGGCNAPPNIVTTTVYAAGPGAASGIAHTPQNTFIAQSGIGTASAAVKKVDLPPPPSEGNPNFVPLWWNERK